MSVRTFLLLAGGVVTYMIILFFAGRRKRPSTLVFKNQTNSLVNSKGDGGPLGAYDAVKKQGQAGKGSAPKKSTPNPEGNERVLQVFFNFNGETFEAYEILGLPPGTPIEEVRRYFAEKYGGVPNSDRIIYQHALEALEESL